MGAWNLPPAMHRLSYLVGAVALMSATSSVYWGPHWPLPVRAALAYTTLVGIVVAAAAANRRSARRWRGIFLKNAETGHIPWPAVLLLWPYHLCVQLVCAGYRSSAHENVFDKLADGLYLGGWPLSRAMLPAPDCAVLDCTNELLRWVKTPAYRAVLVFESWAPEPDDMRAAVAWALAQQAAGRAVFVHCTHGHGRSAVTACAILCAMGKAAGPDEALAKSVKARPGVLPNYRQVALLREWWAAEAGRAHAE